MDVLGTIVKTPYDDGLMDYELNYGYLIAKSWSENLKWRPPVREIAKNRWIIGMRDYFYYLKHGGFLPKSLDMYRHVYAWVTASDANSPRFFIEPFLLTGATFDIISKDFGGTRVTTDMLEAYSRLCFDVRDADGAMSSSAYLRWRSAVPATITLSENTPIEQVWRFFGNYFGYTGLVSVFGIREPHGQVEDAAFLRDETHRLAQLYLIENIVRHRISNYDLNTGLGQYTDYKRFQFESGQEAGREKSGEVISLLMQAMGKMLKPERWIDAASEVDKRPDQTKVLQGKILASKNIEAQRIFDAGKQVGINAVDKHLQDHLTV